MSLDQFATLSRILGHTKSAVVAAGDTVEIYRHLYKANPAQFGVNLASSLGNLASAENASGESGLAIQHSQEQTRLISRLLVDDVKGITSRVDPQEAIKNLLVLSLDAAEEDVHEALSMLNQAVSALENIVVESHNVADFYNDTAYRMGSIIDCTNDTRHLPLAVKLARIATQKAVDKDKQIWGLARETLGFVAGLQLTADSSPETREESKTAFRDAIEYFSERDEEQLVSISLADWEKIHGPYESH